AGAVDPPRRHRSRASGRSDVRNCRVDEQHPEPDDSEDPWHRRHPGSRPAVQEPCVSEERHRAGRDGDANDRAPWIDGCVAWPAVTDRAVPGSSDEDTAAADAVRRIAALSGEYDGAEEQPAA